MQLHINTIASGVIKLNHPCYKCKGDYVPEIYVDAITHLSTKSYIGLVEICWSIKVDHNSDYFLILALIHWKYAYGPGLLL